MLLELFADIFAPFTYLGVLSIVENAVVENKLDIVKKILHFGVVVVL